MEIKELKPRKAPNKAFLKQFTGLEKRRLANTKLSFFYRQIA